jgi:hypothetical protein
VPNPLLVDLSGFKDQEDRERQTLDAIYAAPAIDQPRFRTAIVTDDETCEVVG